MTPSAGPEGLATQREERCGHSRDPAPSVPHAPPPQALCSPCGACILTAHLLRSPLSPATVIWKDTPGTLCGFGQASEPVWNSASPTEEGCAAAVHLCAAVPAGLLRGLQRGEVLGGGSFLPRPHSPRCPSSSPLSSHLCFPVHWSAV